MQEYKLLNSASCVLISDVPVYFYASVCVPMCSLTVFYCWSCQKLIFIPVIIIFNDDIFLARNTDNKKCCFPALILGRKSKYMQKRKNLHYFSYQICLNMPTGQILDKILICYSDLDAYLDFICSEPTHTHIHSLCLHSCFCIHTHTSTQLSQTLQCEQRGGL